MTAALWLAAVGCSASQGREPSAVAADSGASGQSDPRKQSGAAGDWARGLPSAGNAGASGAAGMTACGPAEKSLTISSVPLTAAPPLQLDPGVALLGEGLRQSLTAQQNPSAGLRWQGDRMFLLSDAGFWDIPVAGPARWYPTTTVVLWGVRAGDLDGDGDQDLLLLSMSLNTEPASPANSDSDAGPVGTASPLLSRLTVWERTPEGLSERAELLHVAGMSFPMPYALGDLDADGDLDVVTFERGAALGYRNRGGFVFERELLSERVPASENLSALLVHLADRNHDGLLDLLVIGGDPIRSPLESSIFVSLGQDGGKFAPPGPSTSGKSPLVPYGPDGIGLGIADVTGDGLDDVLTQDPAAPSGIMRLHRSLSATELAPAVELSGLEFAFADVDVDGRTDIITTRNQRLLALLARTTGELELRDLGLDIPSTSTPKFVVDPARAAAGPVLHVLRQQPSCH